MDHASYYDRYFAGPDVHCTEVTIRIDSQADDCNLYDVIDDGGDYDDACDIDEAEAEGEAEERSAHYRNAGCTVLVLRDGQPVARPT